MLRAFHLIVMLAVFCCGLHIAEPVQAHADAQHHQLEQSLDRDEHGTDEGAAAAAHAMHHHCPVASGLSAAPIACAIMRNSMLPILELAANLSSLSQAPPLQPPAA
jgi:hypothetical protein